MAIEVKIAIFSYPMHLTPMLSGSNWNFVCNSGGAQKSRLKPLPDGQKSLTRMHSFRHNTTYRYKWYNNIML